MSDKRTVTVRIRGQDFRIRSDEPAEQLAKIARTVDETMERIESKTGAVDSYGVAMLTALNLAREVVGGEANRPNPDDASRLRTLIDLAESAIASELG